MTEIEKELVKKEDESGLEADELGYDIEVPFDPSKIDIQVKPLSISSLQSRLSNDELDLTPDFQRQANVWDQKRKSRLIESVLLRIPLPSFYFSEDEEGVYAVVDGLQRLCTLFHFMNHEELNRVVKSKLGLLRLKDLQYLKELEGCSFSDLDRKFQRRISELEITSNIIRPNTPPAVKFNVFARLNQGGLPLNAQEIRNAIYPGMWRKKLQELVNSNSFKNATDGKIKPERQQDVELALRFVALWQIGSPFQRHANKTLDEFLNETVENSLRHWNDKDWSLVEKSFIESLDSAVKIFGEHVFRKSIGSYSKSPINRGLFEAQLISISSLQKYEIEILILNKEKISHELKNQLRYGTLLSGALLYATGSAEASNTRIKEITKIFKGVINAN
ncbi:DUF262 domain-containing protein [Vogesella sp. DC21W]|uniref:DUF262 domain-containing protein n=1 Tax=Vogesella aquatica TaxID=2984206 RepID=A0ABT5IYS9_9NEIS|nr:DUF262 domain-containing protein [Vogesella aquatica]MDC7717318.1 DUF262 domain-containing protein [Vogesella aquatica]